jgi:hypothetical protein
MRRRLSLFVFVLFVSSIAAPAPATASGPRPFRGRVTAQWDNIYEALPLSLGGIGLAHFAGGGPVTHMGNTMQVGSLTLEEPIGPGVFPGSGTVTITAANGDSLTFDYVGVLYAATGEGIGSFTFTGGSGRFAGATGGGSFHAQIDLSYPVDQPMTVDLDGQVSY